MAADIEHWLDTPKPLSAFLGDVTHEALAEDDDSMVVPVEVCLKEIWIEALRGDMNRYAESNSLPQKVGAAMREIESWDPRGAQFETRKYGRRWTFLRRGISGEEREQGYRIISGAVDAGSLESLI